MNVSRTAKVLSAALPLFALSPCALAVQEAVTTGPVVVTAAGYEQDTTEAPASVSVITHKELMTKPVSDLGQAVGDVPGVDISETKMGNTQISIRGFDSAYTLVMVDGRRMNTSDGMVNNGFDPASVIMPPPGAIERIEVLRGPASTVWGSDAVGGVINIITKKHYDKFSGTIKIDRKSFFENDEYGDQTGVGVTLGVPLKKDVASLQLRGRYIDRQGSGLRTPDGKFAGHSPSEGYTGNIGSRLTLTIDPANEIYFDGDYTRFKGGAMNTSAYAVKNVRWWDKYNAVIGHNGNYDFGKTETFFQWNSLSYMKNYSGYGKAANGTVSPEATTKGSFGDPLMNSTMYTLSTKLMQPLDFGDLGGMTLTTGVEGNYETFKDNSANAASTGLTYAGSTLPSMKGEKIDETTLAAFAEGEYFINDEWTATLGGRLHWSDSFGAHFSPRAYLVYKPTDFFSVKGGVSSGYKTPSVKHLYDGVYYYGSGRVTNYYVGDSNLKPEKSLNYELSATLQDASLGSVTLGLFYTDFKDKLAQEIKTIANKTYLYQDVTYGKVRARGVELLLKTARFNGFSFTGGYTFTDTKIKSGETNAGLGTRLNELPQHSLTARIDYQNGDFGAYLKSVSKFDSKVQTVGRGELNDSRYKNYTKVDFGIDYTYAKQHHFSLALNNIFNTGLQWEEAVGSTAAKPTYANAYRDYIEGRNLWLSYAYTF